MEEKMNEQNEQKGTGRQRRPRLGRMNGTAKETAQRVYHSKPDASDREESNGGRRAYNSFDNNDGERPAPRFKKKRKPAKPRRLKGSEEIIPNKIKRRKSRQAPPEPKYDGTTRLNKYISNAGICSRREADKLIEAGAVSVNGEVVTTLGFKVKEGDVVSYGGEILRSEPKRYFLLNKPKGYITTLDDPQERQTVMLLVQGCCKERIYPVGRLDKNTTGLLLFTNDGEMAKRLTHPSSNVYKIYQVECDRAVSREDMQQMIDGIELEDGPIAVDDIQYQGDGKDRRIVGVALHSGKNRIVRRIFEHFGYEVKKLDRCVFAGLTKKDLPRGKVRELTQQEVNYLMMV
ncbi:MAG: rRNA pseudouridine synthase [Bacteroidales bacterium]|nr:rRNA pseudouridine synthase [Bacteroidales bacterium]